ncbi:MAG: DUF4393 domain-containing protein [Oceanospirillaceae bacterium]|nr:DUF4393 domain-containing protein [Oceanospirillaceae bacterium]
MFPEILKEIISVPGLLEKIYEDLAQPGVRKVGKAIEGILGLGNTCLYPIHLANERTSIHLKKNLERYRKKLENVPAENIIPVPAEIGVPILEKLAYTSDENLSELFTNLLANASTNNTAHKVHPGFLSKLSNLSPDEAKLLVFAYNNKGIYLHRVTPNTADQNNWFLAVENDALENLQYPENAKLYIDNLGALNILFWSFPHNTPNFDATLLNNKSFTLNLDKSYIKYFNINIENTFNFDEKSAHTLSILKFSMMGLNFCEACLESNK